VSRLVISTQPAAPSNVPIQKPSTCAHGAFSTLEAPTQTLLPLNFARGGLLPQRCALLDGSHPDLSVPPATAQIIREKQLARQLKNMLEQLEANATRARREELQLRHSVVQLAQWIATTAMAPAVAATALATAGSFAARAASMSAAVTAKALSASPAGTATTAATAATGTVPAPPRVHTSCSAEANAEFELGELGEPPLLRIISSNTLMVASA